MKLSKDEYQRGVISWKPTPPATTSVRSFVDGQSANWTAPLDDPDGSIVPERLGTPIQLRFGRADASDEAFPYPARLERLDPDGAVRTRIWDRYDNEEVQLTLAHVPNYGYFHRIVISGTMLVWDEDVIVRHDDVLIRFISVVVIGEYAPPMNNVEPAEGGYAVTGRFGTETLSGRFIDITAPGASLQEAERRARGTYGLITLLFGDQCIGEVVIENSYEALPRNMQRSFANLDVVGRPGLRLPDEAFTKLEETVSRANQRDAMAKYVDLALHWYEQGCRASSNLDRFVALFIGAETLFKGFVRLAGGVREAQQRRSRYEPALRKAFSQSMEKGILESLIGSLGRASQREEFEAYALSRQLPGEIRSKFPRLSRVRNGIVHGDATEPELEDVHDIRMLLTTMLKTELEIGFQVPWERNPGLGRIHLPFDYTNYGWNPASAAESSA